MTRLKPNTSQPHVFAFLFCIFVWQNHYLGPSKVPHDPSGAFRWAIWASPMWACAIWASSMWACATWASSRASGLDNCCCLLLCALPWLGWLARCALPCQPLFRNNNSTAAFGGRRRLRRRCCCCCGTEAGKARRSEQASQAKAKHIATNNNNERGLAFRVCDRHIATNRGLLAHDGA